MNNKVKLDKDYIFGLDLSMFFGGETGHQMGFEWDLLIKDSKTLKKIQHIATVEIRPSEKNSLEYEVFFSDDNRNWILGRHCSIKEANSRATNAIEKYKRKGTLDEHND